MYRGLVSFLGPKVIRNLALSLLTGLVFWAVELGFAVVIQTFFVSLGLATREAVSVPHFLLDLGLVAAVLMITGLGLSRSLLSWAQTYLQNTAMIHLLYRLRLSIAEWVYRSDSVSTNRVVTLYNERAGGAGSAVLYLQNAVFLVVTGFFSLVSLFYLLPGATAVSLVFLAVLFFPLKALNRKIEKIGWDFGTYWDQVNGRLLLSIRNLLLIRIHGMIPSEAKRARSDLGRYQHLALGYHRLTGVSSVLPSFIGLFLIVWIVLRYRGTVTPGILVSYFYLFFRFLQNASQLSVAASNIQFMGPQLRDLLQWWHSEYLPSEAVASRSVVVETLAAPIGSAPVALRAQKLGFAYDSSGRPIFQDLNLDLRFGECCVITGPSGVGKSTFLNLLIGELSPTMGCVEYSFENGMEWKSTFQHREALRSRIGYVGPESFVVPGTLRENLVYGLNRTINADDIRDALEKASCDFVLSDLTLMDRQISEQGHGLSAGQKQRLALARALLRNPGLLVLDEATANIDGVTERQIVEALHRLKGTVTMVIVTHRENLLAIADHRIQF